MSRDARRLRRRQAAGRNPARGRCRRRRRSGRRSEHGHRRGAAADTAATAAACGASATAAEVTRAAAAAAESPNSSPNPPAARSSGEISRALLEAPHAGLQELLAVCASCWGICMNGCNAPPSAPVTAPAALLIICGNCWAIWSMPWACCSSPAGNFVAASPAMASRSPCPFWAFGVVFGVTHVRGAEERGCGHLDPRRGRRRDVRRDGRWRRDGAGLDVAALLRNGKCRSCCALCSPCAVPGTRRSGSSRRSSDRSRGRRWRPAAASCRSVAASTDSGYALNTLSEIARRCSRQQVSLGVQDAGAGDARLGQGVRESW